MRPSYVEVVGSYTCTQKRRTTTAKTICDCCSWCAREIARCLLLLRLVIAWNLLTCSSAACVSQNDDIGGAHAAAAVATVINWPLIQRHPTADPRCRRCHLASHTLEQWLQKCPATTRQRFQILGEADLPLYILVTNQQEVKLSRD